MSIYERLKPAIEGYKAYFPAHWKDERYKWEAIKWFQDHWDIDATDFHAMLETALDKTKNLLTSFNNFPRGMIQGFAEAAPEEVRAMFADLYNEADDVVDRIRVFRDKSQELLKKYGGKAVQHYQNENAVSIYLWLRYPDKYFVYKYTEVKTVMEKLSCDYPFKKGGHDENMRSFLALYNEIRDVVSKDAELAAMLQSNLTEDCYSDPEFCTLTTDIGFYISRFYQSEDSQQIQPSDYNPYPAMDVNPAEENIDNQDVRYWLYAPGRDAGFWDEFYNQGIMAIGWEEIGNLSLFPDRQAIQQAMQATRGSGSFKNDTLATWEFANKMKPGDIVFVKKGKRQIIGKGVITSGYIFDQTRESYHNVRKVHWTHKGEWMLSEPGPVKTLTDITGYPDFMQMILSLFDEAAPADASAPISNVEQGQDVRYWFLNAKPAIWSIADMQIGDEVDYSFYNENGNKRRIFRNFQDARIGDIMIGYEATPVKQVVSILRVTKKVDEERICFKKIRHLTHPITLKQLQDCPELESMEFLQNPQGSLFKLTEGEYHCILELIQESETAEPPAPAYPAYTKSDFLAEVYMDEAKYDKLVSVLKRKKNIILQGAPGVGKTFAAKRLAYSIMGKKNEACVEFVQFHQNYSYEDFVMGYKPSEEGDGFQLKDGIFYRFCEKAKKDVEGKPYFFIIDEINRGNMSKIFGELLMLIESGYRGTETTLAYTGKPFSVPENLYIIGMMNTADRSLAMIDYALRRRFSFFDMEPGFDTEGFKVYRDGFANDTFYNLIDCIKDLNDYIVKDKSLGKGFCIGHSYFCNAEACTEAWMQEVVEYDILPMLQEYWFDDPSKVRTWEDKLNGVFQ